MPHLRLEFIRFTRLPAGKKPARLCLWGPARRQLPPFLEAVTGREDGSTVYSSLPLACSISAREAWYLRLPHTCSVLLAYLPDYNLLHFMFDTRAQVLANVGSLQAAYARFPLLCTPSETKVLPPEAG